MLPSDPPPYATSNVSPVETATPDLLDSRVAQFALQPDMAAGELFMEFPDPADRLESLRLIEERAELGGELSHEFAATALPHIEAEIVKAHRSVKRERKIDRHAARYVRSVLGGDGVSIADYTRGGS